MRSLPQQLPRKPEARTEKVEDIVDLVLRGQVRVPDFQRGLRWTSKNVVDLFDSIYRGYPIGSLLFYKRPAAAQRLSVGCLVVDGPQLSEAWWVVDGQQRVTTLAACLGRQVPIPSRRDRHDPFVLYFDAQKHKFEPPPSSGSIPSSWVPLPYLLDASRLTEWIFGWRYGKDELLRRVVFEAGTRLREYPIPLYLIEGQDRDDSKLAREIFYRINKAGEPLDWTDVHKALFGGEGSSPSTLEELSEELADIGMGRLGGGRLLTCLLAMRGRNPTQTLGDQIRKDPEVLSGAVQEAVPVLRGVLSFLRRDAAIPHLRLLPKSILLDVLTRFFALNSDPKARTRTLLARWFWRTALGAGSFDERTLRRRGIAAVSEDEERSVQSLLGLLRKERPRPVDLPMYFDARADGSRIALLALCHLGPRELRQGRPIDVAGLLEEQDKAAFLKIIKQPGLEGSRSPANRMIQPKGTPALRCLRERISDHGSKHMVLASHAITGRAADCLAAGDPEGFVAARAEALTEEVRRFSERMAAWDHSDRPSVEFLLEEAGVGV